MELTTVSSGVFSQVSHSVSSVSHLLTRARPGLPHQHSKVASSGHMAELLSSSRRIHTWSFTLSLSTLIKLGLLTLNCSCVWKNVGMQLASQGEISILSWGGGQDGFNFSYKTAPTIPVLR